VAAFFFDSSALVKAYVQETGTAWVRSLLAPAAGHEVHVTRITEVEVTAAVVRRHKAGTISAADTAAVLGQLPVDLANHFIVLNVSDQVLATAVTLVKIHELRAYDAVQLATAVTLNQHRSKAGLPAADFVSADIDLNTAALVEGFSLDDPNAHP
jgi:predicted nucleic acid-binding protein